jgi:hypothetical protein
MSMFGGFGPAPADGRAQLGNGPGVIQSVTPVGSSFGGGFPGIYPAMGPGQSGAAGLIEFIARRQRQRVTPIAWGPPAFWLGKRK